MQLINLIASMYEYPKEILIFGRNINIQLSAAYYSQYWRSYCIFNIADYGQLEKYTQLCRFTTGFGTSVDQSSDEV